MKQQWLLLLATVGMIVGVMADDCDDCANCYVGGISVADAEANYNAIQYCTEGNLNDACGKLNGEPTDSTDNEPCGSDYSVNNATICFDQENNNGVGYCQSCKNCQQAKGRRTYVSEP
jgi:hypothetical protein